MDARPTLGAKKFVLIVVTSIVCLSIAFSESPCERKLMIPSNDRAVSSEGVDDARGRLQILEDKEDCGRDLGPSDDK